ncbi:hypothetical protein H6F42_13935 [Pseudanabaena sp. FACHB-1998]|uniref:hypothetical protein n=1 Tax=Pseudanabaena sp. FACHB-1998 TaxID=2692858 RepID=UPI0016812CA1|nr:hypothetical protein [Pseudanabaena sp. FACHB-1998]MBD2178017.1 hypothetical protein [Pseudanabaena sp. FACHB-1998]
MNINVLKNLYAKNIVKVILIALLIITVINRGSLGSIDTSVRLQMAHAWWTGTEEVDPNYQPKFRGDLQVGVTGVGGKRYLSYDLGQSVLMLPGDWLGTQIHRFSPNTSLMDLRHAVVSYLVFVPLNIAAVIVCFWLLKLLDFSDSSAGLTTAAWLLCTTVLAYAQEPQHNNQVLLFVALAYASILAHIKDGRSHFVVIGGFASSFALLIRASSIAHVLTIAIFTLACSVYHYRQTSKVLKTFALWILGFLPLGILGRVFDYLRYGSFLTTGQALSAQQFTTDPKWQGFPEFPPNYPFINEPHVGVIGVLFSPIKSIFIYDPLLIPCLIIGFLYWKKLSYYIKAYLLVGILNLILHISLTSKLIFWGGDLSWGARYHVTSVHLLIIPLLGLLVQETLLSKGFRLWVLRGVLAIALIVQLASVTMYHGVEISQSPLKKQDLAPEIHSSQFRLGQRFINIACHFNPSLSTECLKDIQVLPFRKNPPVFIWVWRFLVALAIAATFLFISQNQKLAKRELLESQNI